MSIIEQGKTELELREVEKERKRQQKFEEDQSNKKRTSQRFYMDFYAHHRKPNPNYKHYGDSRVIYDPPVPEIEEWQTLEHGNYRADSTFVCEGVKYQCHWKDERRSYGDDRAYWDDGWWPEWYVVLEKRILWLAGLKRTVRIQVWGPAQVVEALK